VCECVCVRMYVCLCVCVCVFECMCGCVVTYPNKTTKIADAHELFFQVGIFES